MLYEATHVTRYTYEGPVSQCLNEARLTPRSFPGQRTQQSTIKIVPEPAIFEHRMDYFGNDVTTFTVLQTHDELTTTATSIVEVERQPPPMLPDLPWEEASAHLAAHLDSASLEAYEFVFDSPYVAASPQLATYAQPTFRPGRPLVEAVTELSHRIHTEFRYQPKSTSIDMPLTQVLANRRGVCQDFSHVMIGALRSMHLAARYVSGYLRSGSDVQGAEASHAWVAVFIPAYGWLSFDPTNDILPTDGHITLAWGRDYGDVTPIKGIALGGGAQTIEVSVDVRPMKRAF
jgi:transglutaminase-like putative cysteine protease